jgi:hypothetical protein
MRPRVENEETTDVDIGICGERRSGVKSIIRVFLHDRKVFVSFILAQIRGYQEVVVSSNSVRWWKGNGVLFLV